MFRTKRGWHLLGHNTGPGSSVLSYSLDGLNWTIPKGSPNTFNMSLCWANGTQSTVCSRQRPQVVMGEDGMPGWLWNGVGDCNASGALSARTWTLAQRIGRPPQEATAPPAGPRAARAHLRAAPPPIASRTVRLWTGSRFPVATRWKEPFALNLAQFLDAPAPGQRESTQGKGGSYFSS